MRLETTRNQSVISNGFLDALIKMLVGAVIGVLVFVATGYMDNKARISAIEVKQVEVDRQFAEIKAALTRLENKVDRLPTD